MPGKKVIIPMYSTFPHRTGGREVWLEGLAKELARRGYEPVFATVEAWGASKSHSAAKSRTKIRPVVTLMTVMTSSRFLSKLTGLPVLHNIMALDFYIYSFFASSSALAGHELDATFIIPNPGVECLPALAVRRKGGGCKIITLVMGEWLKDISMSFPAAKGLFASLEKETLRESDLVVYPAQCMLDADKKRLGFAPKHAAIIPFGGLDGSFFRPPTPDERAQARKKFGIQGDKFAISCVAILRALKGQEVLIKALNSLGDEDIVALFAGKSTGDYAKKLKRLCANKCNAMFLGEIGRDEIRELLWASDAFALPSLSEGLPISIMEAIACDVPVIATNVGAIAEVVGDCGIMVPPSDEKRLAEAVARMKGASEIFRRKCAVSAGRMASTYSSDSSYDRLINELASLESRE